MGLDLQDISKYEFYHVIEVSPGVSTPGIPSLLPLQAPVHDEIRRLDLTGKRVLDIGCRDGMFGFEAERLGASEIVGIDNDLSRGAVEFLIPWFHSKMKMMSQNLYELSSERNGKFDLVIFAGVLYHLRFPFYGLKRIADVMRPGGVLIVETGLLLSHAQHPFIFSPPPEESPFDPTSVTFFNHRALMAGLGTLGFSGIECRNVQVWGAVPKSYAGWDAFLAGPDGPIARSSEIVVGRGTYVCRFDGATDRQADSDLQAYWLGEHHLNSDKLRAEEFLDAYRPKQASPDEHAAQGRARLARDVVQDREA